MRLVTRSDFDGLACGALLFYLGIVDEWLFVHPKDIQDGVVEVTENDVLANIPYAKGCHLWFDHHSSESERLGPEILPNMITKLTSSCARVIYDYYGGEKKLGRFAEMLEYVDRIDSAHLTQDEILNPKRWVLLGFIMDPRTGLGRFRNFTISNLDLMKKLARDFVDKSIDEILEMPDVKERITLYQEQEKLFIEMLRKYSRTDGPVVITDLRGVETINAGNRFIIYGLYPDQNISVWVVDGRQKVNCSIGVGYSIINQTAIADVGSILLKYGGGGHQRVGTCQVDYGEADRIIGEIVEQLKG